MNLEIIAFNDHYVWPYPEGYRDINIIIRDPINQHLGEIQINTKSMLEFKHNGGHMLFDCKRKLIADSYKRELNNEELDLMNYITQISQYGYNTAYQKSLTYNGKPLRIGIYGIATKEDKILLVPTQSGSKKIFNFPGGGVEQNECFADSLIRECQEEICCKITIGDYYDCQIWQHPDFQESIMFNIYYKIKLESEPLDGIWISSTAFDNYSLLPPDKEILNSLIKN